MTDQEQTILKAIQHAGRGGPATIAQVIKAVGYPKATVKHVLISLLQKGAVVLHRHDWPQSLKPAERKNMILLAGSYYGAVTVNRRNPGKGKKALKTAGRAVKGAARSILAAGSQILGAGATALNPRGKHLRGLPAKAQREYEHILAEAKRTGRYGKRKEEVAARTVEKQYGGSTKKRRKAASTKKTARRRNLGHKDSNHPVEVKHHYRAGPPGYLTPWQRAHHAGQKDLFAHGITPAKKRNAAKKRRRNADQWPDLNDHHKAAAMRAWAHAASLGPYKFATQFRKALKQAIETNVSHRGTVGDQMFNYAWVKHAGKWQQNPTRKRASTEDIYVGPTKRVYTRRGGKRIATGVVLHWSPSLRRYVSIPKKENKAPRKLVTRSCNPRRRASKKRGPIATARAKAGAKVRRKGRRNPTATEIRKEFAGRAGAGRDLYFPKGTPPGELAKLGKLVLIKTCSGDIAPVAGVAWLCADERGKLHIGATKPAPLYSGPAGRIGKVHMIEYEETKPHLGYKNPTIWFHKLGEETGHRPTLHADAHGGLHIRGGAYRITRRGIEN